MSAQSLQEDQLLELLLQLKKTTPEEARAILHSQPQIAYALMAVLVNINAVNAEVVQNTMTAYSAQSGTAPAPAPAPAPGPSAPPMPAIPPHLAQPPPRGGTPTYPPQRGATPTYPPHQPAGYPPSYSTPPPQHGFGGPLPASQIPGLGAYPPQPAPAPVPPPAASKSAQSAASILAAALQKVPDEQKPLVMQIISMTREEIFAMPPTERDNVIKLRSTLGLTT
ncbi:uncharacterized protein C8Q71DRAFT_757575 [Rhodofomes roseus]|uniref:Cleavage stimulation factor subunit 2 hinge domain-containing protein n=1 Tax=Rhodofomes roseus TaxID=34475 RepID=A0ABQ8KHR0_9APHY|nr:uncharacterized protein C8Q71DRAFT_757575 [Rhodofomes roseus]KAH9837284.1 hypothetical protein C8Q71DRAFT_757575 [Rhodofomes roseus]